MTRSIQLGPYTFFADDASRPGLDILQNGFNYEAHVVAELRRLVPSSTGFLDIGTNCGIHTLIAKTIQPALPIVCAEVSQFNLDMLLRNIIHNQLSNVIVLPFALAHEPCLIRANCHEPNTCVSLQGHPDSEDYPRLAAALSLDLLNLPSIDLIKIDIEGFELHALNGASRIIAQRPRIIFEYCPELTHRSNSTPIGFLQWFLDRRYQLTTLDYVPNMRATFTNAQACLAHVKQHSKWICDILAEPLP